MRRSREDQRGSAIIVSMGIVILVLLTVLALISFSGLSRSRATAMLRSMNRLTCAQDGLELARAYYGRNFPSWNNYLSQPSIYNPVATAWNTTPAVPTSAALQTSNPELFADLDGDGVNDVYIYIRDNADELPPAVNNPARDNDQNVIAGALCISKTLTPHLQNGSVDPTLQYVEGLLNYNMANSVYRASAHCGGTGSGNCN